MSIQKKSQKLIACNGGILNPLRIFKWKSSLNVSKVILFLAITLVSFQYCRGEDYTLSIPLVDSTGLSNHKVYVVGYSVASKNQLEISSGTTATFKALPGSTGTFNCYELGSEITEITMAITNPVGDNSVDGARVYFFVDSTGSATKPAITYSPDPSDASKISVVQPGIFPSADELPNMFIELTYVDPTHGPVIDLSFVDNWIFPMNIKLNDSLGEIGTPSTLTRKDVLDAYIPFFNQLSKDDQAEAFSKMEFTEYGGGLLNPGHYIDWKNSVGNLFIHADNTLHSAFDEACNTLFSNSKLSMIGFATKTIESQAYTVKTSDTQTLPESTFTHPALVFQGVKNTSLEFTIFNPVGIYTLNYVIDKKAYPIIGTVTNKTLTFATSLPGDLAISEGMWVTGAGLDANSTIAAINKGTDGKITSVTFATDYKLPAKDSSYAFTKTPLADLQFSSGSMILGCLGALAYSDKADADEKTIHLGLENQIAAALNRGVANKGPDSGDAGYTSYYWSTETNWYPEGEPQNLYSLFMHTALKDTTPIFLQPANAVNCARGTKMGQSYGFAYDEDPAPAPPSLPDQPHVPSKWDPLVPSATTATITLLPWGSSEKSATLTMDVSPGASGTVSPGTSSHRLNSKVEITAKHADNYHFVQWHVKVGDSTVSVSTENPHSFTISGDATATAYFEADAKTATLTMAVSPTSGGSTTPSVPATVDQGEPQTIKADAADGYQFISWTSDQNATFTDATAASTRVTLSGDSTVTATFTLYQPDTVTLGSIIEIKASEVDSSASSFQKKPKVSVNYTDPVKSKDGKTNLTVVTKVNKNSEAEKVSALWKKKIALFNKKDYKAGEKSVHELLAATPISSLTTEKITVLAKDISPDTVTLDRVLHLPPPVISNITGKHAAVGDVFTVIGKYFGSKPPNVYLEYSVTTGKGVVYKLKKCKILKKDEEGNSYLLFKDAKNKLNKSCMKVWDNDTVFSSDPKTVGYSQVTVEYPKITDKMTLTNYLIVDNKIGIATIKLP